MNQATSLGGLLVTWRVAVEVVCGADGQGVEASEGPAWRLIVISDQLKIISFKNQLKIVVKISGSCQFPYLLTLLLSSLFLLLISSQIVARAWKENIASVYFLLSLFLIPFLPNPRLPPSPVPGHTHFAFLINWVVCVACVCVGMYVQPNQGLPSWDEQECLCVCHS